MGEKKKKPVPKMPKGIKSKKKIVAITMEPEVLQWSKGWAARRDRSLSWAINHFANERRNRELAEKHLGQKVVGKK